MIKIPDRSGVVIAGVESPILKPGDDIEKFVCDSLIPYNELGSLNDEDVVCITESVVARAQNNFITINQIAKNFRQKMNYQEGEKIGIISPILSRNRYSMMLHAFARATPNIELMLSYPRDEQGNQIMSDEDVVELGKNPFTDTINMKEYDSLSKFMHPSTYVNYIDLYKGILKKENCDFEIYLGNNPLSILEKTDKVLVSNVHSRFKDKERLNKTNAKIVLGLDDLCNESSEEHGYNPQFGLLGSNISDPEKEKLKLFPRDGDLYACKIKDSINKEFGKNVHVLIYADGAYKDPSTGIWELADPVVVAGCTDEIKNRIPKELKLKYLADKYLGQGLCSEEVERKIKQEINNKASDLEKKFESQGTTPRMVKDLIGSLADLTSGSGDRGTPIVLVKGYFKNYGGGC